MLQVVLLLAIGNAVFVLLGYLGGRIARRSRRDRRTAMWIFALSFVAGLVIALWLPHRAPPDRRFGRHDGRDPHPLGG